jgi:hypothetical protein
VAAGLALLAGLALGGWLLLAPAQEVDFFRYRPGDGGTASLVSEADASGVRPGDTLVLEVASSRAAWVYVLGWFGKRGEGRLLQTIEPLVLQADEEPDARGEGLGIPVAGGRTRLAATTVEPREPPASFEGLMVWVVDEPWPQMEAWLARLARLERRAPSQAVGWAEARAAWDEPAPVPRGGRPDLTPEQERDLARRLTSAELLEDPRSGMFTMALPVEP